MNKLIYLLMISLVSLTSLAQDTIRIPQSEIDEIISTMDTLVEQDSINNALIKQYEILIGDYEALVKQDSLILSFRDKEVYLYSEQIKLYEKKIKVIDKWYNRRPFGFILGIATSVVLIHTVGYTLP
tara:strand:- start:1386 stop:1766 length:381 start_codon:yes stop_codon:yes gene_type:complete